MRLWGKVMKNKHLAIAILAAATAVAPAQAGNFRFTYTGDPVFGANTVMSATLNLTTSDVLNAVGGYDILSADGTIDGVTVLGLQANLTPPDPILEGYFRYDNVLYLSGPVIDPWGLVVNTAGGSFNFGWVGDPDSPSSYYAIMFDGTTHINPHTGLPVPTSYYSEGAVSLAAVPEPASWAMMVTGFGLAGAAMRRRRTAISFA